MFLDEWAEIHAVFFPVFLRPLTRPITRTRISKAPTLENRTWGQQPFFFPLVDERKTTHLNVFFPFATKGASPRGSPNCKTFRHRKPLKPRFGELCMAMAPLTVFLRGVFAWNGLDGPIEWFSTTAARTCSGRPEMAPRQQLVSAAPPPAFSPK